MVRMKHRYFVINAKKIRAEQTTQITEATLNNCIFNAVRHMHGVFGSAAILNGVNIKYINKETGLGVIKVKRGPHRLVASVLPIIGESLTGDRNVPMSITTLYTGATIKQCLWFIKKHQMDSFDQIVASLKDDEKDILRKKYMKFNVN